MKISHPTPIRRLRRYGLAPLLIAAFLLAGCSGHAQPNWQLTDIRGHMPDLHFRLTDDNGKTVTAKDFRGKVVLLYFGYTHCPDVCPTTMTKMHVIFQRLGKLADQARFLFVTVDPSRDTPQVLHQYVNAFDSHDVGLTGSESEIRSLAKRYRAAFSRGKSTPGGGYDMNHSAAIYVFDRKGRARLLITPTTSPDAIVHDLHLLITLTGNT